MVAAVVARVDIDQSSVTDAINTVTEHKIVKVNIRAVRVLLPQDLPRITLRSTIKQSKIKRMKEV